MTGGLSITVQAWQQGRGVDTLKLYAGLETNKQTNKGTWDSVRMSVHQLVLPSPLCSPMFLPFLQHRGCQGWRRQGPVRPGPGWSLRSHILSPGPPGCWRGSLAGWWWGPRWCTAPSRIWHSWGGGGGRGQLILTYIIDKNYWIRDCFTFIAADLSAWNLPTTNLYIFQDRIIFKYKYSST